MFSVPRQALRKIKGLTLIETLMALTVGGMIITGSVEGVVNYNQSIKVQAAALLLNRVHEAADQYASDNFDVLVTNAPQSFNNINNLNPYLGNPVLQDPFRAAYRMHTRTYNYTTRDPATGGNVTKTALQLLVEVRRTGANPDQVNELDQDPAIRVQVANSAGPNAGFRSTMDGQCSAQNGSSRPTGSICGAYGSYSVGPNYFSNTDGRTRYVSMVTKGDSSVYGDQLYRYDFGDPELNTMHTDLNMDANEINNAEVITDTSLFEMKNRPGASGRSVIRNNQGALAIIADTEVRLQPGNNETLLVDTGAGYPSIKSNTNTMQLGDGGDNVFIGDRRVDTVAFGGSTRASALGTGDLFIGRMNGDTARLKTVNSLHQVEHDPLRLQKFRNGEVVIGSRVDYRPDPGRSGARERYALSDGKLTTGIITTQDITCADCGGNLSQILPRWRHMGTYFISNEMKGADSGQIVPKPECQVNRRDALTRGSAGDEPSYFDTSQDNRYEPKIMLIPKHMKTMSVPNGWEQTTRFDIELQAKSINGSQWRVWTNNELGNTNTRDVKVEAFALTYCVFVGGWGRELNPANLSDAPTRTGWGNGDVTWSRLD